MAIDNLWSKAFGGVGGGLFSLLGIGTSSAAAPVTTGVDGLAAIHHSGYGPGDPISMSRMVSSSIFANAPRFHTGIGPGERAAVIRDDESVLTPGQMRALAPAKSSSQPIVVSVAPVYNFNNADPSVEARLRQQIAQSAQDTQQKTIAAVSKLSQNSPGNYLPPKR